MPRVLPNLLYTNATQNLTNNLYPVLNLWNNNNKKQTIIMKHLVRQEEYDYEKWKGITGN